MKKLGYRTVVMAVIASDLYNRSYYDGRYDSGPNYSADGQHNTNHGVSLCALVVVCFLLVYSLNTKTLYKSSCIGKCETLYRYRDNDRNRPEDKRSQIKKGAHNGGNDDQDKEVFWPVVVWILRTWYWRRKDGRGRDL